MFFCHSNEQIYKLIIEKKMDKNKSTHAMLTIFTTATMDAASSELVTLCCDNGNNHLLLFTDVMAPSPWIGLGCAKKIGCSRVGSEGVRDLTLRNGLDQKKIGISRVSGQVTLCRSEPWTMTRSLNRQSFSKGNLHRLRVK